ncbi:MAG: VOC family protein [Planctomycetes bacterium]|nr:VOC family protein [Planctomycetota bacterium]
MIPVTNIKTCLWFATEAEEAVRFYTSIFAGSKVLGETRWGEGGFGPPGSIISMDFELAGRPFMALNGAQGVAFNDSVSIAVDCASQVEIDALWEKLCAGGKPGQCGWLKDKFGVSWQVVPKELPALLMEKDPVKRKRVIDAMLQMSKLDLARLKQARDGR